MPDDKTKKIPQDSGRISLNDPGEVRYWRKKFRCTKDELQRAVAAVGDSADAVENWIQQLHIKRRLRESRNHGWSR